MFRDAPGLPFLEDGVSPDLVRAGEPRLRRSRMRDTPVAEPAPARRRAPLLARLLHPVSS